jgi:hypothetical protein
VVDDAPEITVLQLPKSKAEATASVDQTYLQTRIEIEAFVRFLGAQAE